MPNFLIDDYKITKGVQLPPLEHLGKKIDIFKKKHFHIILVFLPTNVIYFTKDYISNILVFALP